MHLHADRNNPWKLSSYSKGRAIQLTEEQASTLKGLLQEPSSYSWNRSLDCAPNYGVLFVFHTAPTDTVLGLCFECGKFGLFAGTKSLNTEDEFHPVRPELVALVRQLFPNDEEIQKLK